MILFLYVRIENWRMKGILDERERLALEMHDTLAQSFAGVGYQLQGIRNGNAQRSGKFGPTIKRSSLTAHARWCGKRTRNPA